MAHTVYPPETMESRDNRWVVACDPRTGLFWRSAPPGGIMAACGHPVPRGGIYYRTTDVQRVCAACMQA